MKLAEFITAAARNISSGVLAIGIILSLDSCSSKTAFLNSQVVPAARGSVKVKKDNNHNYVIQVHVRNLAEVKRLDPPKQTYVVWMSDRETTKNIGQIKSSSSLLSKNLKASFETVSSTRPLKIFITAEEDGNTQTPGMQILATNNF